MKYDITAGIDIHKKQLTVSIYNKALDTHKNFRVSNDEASIVSLLSRFIVQGVQAVAMESTGKLHRMAYQILNSAKMFDVLVCHPKYVKAIDGDKTDDKDALRIAKRLANGEVVASYIPTNDEQALRDFTRHRDLLVKQKSQIITIMKEQIFSLNFNLTSYITTYSSQSFQNILNYFATHYEKGDFKLDAILKLLHSSTRKFGPDILILLQNAYHNNATKLYITLQIDRYNLLSKQIAMLEQEITRFITEAFPQQLNILLSVPRIGYVTAAEFIGEIGDVKRFANSNSMVKYARMSPGTDNSDGKIKSNKIPKGGLIKKAAVELTHRIIKNNPYYHAKYLLLLKRKNKNIAIMAIARKILVHIYKMLLNNEPFNPSFCEEVIELVDNGNAIVQTTIISPSDDDILITEISREGESKKLNQRSIPIKKRR